MKKLSMLSAKTLKILGMSLVLLLLLVGCAGNPNADIVHPKTIALFITPKEESVILTWETLDNIGCSVDVFQNNYDGNGFVCVKKSWMFNLVTSPCNIGGLKVGQLYSFYVVGYVGNFANIKSNQVDFTF